MHPAVGIYHDYRAVMHVHAEDAEHTLGTRQQVLEGAKAAGVKVVLSTDHRGPKPDSWQGMHDGVLFIQGSEDGDNKLRYPKSGDDLQFLCHLEEIPDRSSDGYQGMEIYNRHYDAKVHQDLTDYLLKAMKEGHEFAKLTAKLKEFPDEVFAAGTGALPLYLERFDREIEKHPFTGIAANDAHRNTILNKVVFDPYEVAFRNVSTHILARELSEAQIRKSLREGHAYVAHDWLCDPEGFAFAAANNYGLYEMGDHVPMINGTELHAVLPVAAHVKIIHGGKVVHEATAARVRFKPSEEGAYRMEAWLTVDGEERPWIYSNPLYLSKQGSALVFPPATLAANVKVVRNVSYAGDELAKHKLDLYLPADQTAPSPVLLFIHGGSWRSGDRSQYTALGNRFAKAGIVTVVASYRLAPQDKPPAQIEDVAAAFAWTMQHIAEYGGDPKRVYIAGHSAGGHLVSELALDGKWLAKHGLTPAAIRGVAALSGVYDVGGIETFGADAAGRKQYSPLAFVTQGAPPFVVTYCEHDYASLAPQARLLDAALRKAYVPSKLVFVPAENHISEMVNVWKDDAALAESVLGLVRGSSGVSEGDR